MESIKASGGHFFVQRMLRNKMLLLMVVLAVCVTVYITVGLVKLIG